MQECSGGAHLLQYLRNDWLKKSLTGQGVTLGED